VPPRKPRNPARKRVTKKLKVSETTPQEVRRLDQCSRVLVVPVHLLMTKLHLLAGGAADGARLSGQRRRVGHSGGAGWES
jgi:hypothetical protein